MISHSCSSVRWPKQRTLCLPSFLDTTNQLHTESVREGQLAPESVREGQLAPESVRESQLAPEQPVNQTSISLSSSDTPQEESKSTPLLPLSTTEREREEKDSEEEEVVKEKGQEEDGNEKEKGKLEENNEGKITHRPRGSVLETEAANTMLEWLNAAPLLVGEALPQDRAELMKLRLQTQMELVWLQQAIASRIKVGVILQKSM